MSQPLPRGEETQLSLIEWQSLLEMTSELFSRTNESLGAGVAKTMEGVSRQRVRDKGDMDQHVIDAQ